MTNPEALVEAVAKAMREAVIRDDEGEFPRLFDLLGFSGENKAHTVVRGLARVAITEAFERAAMVALGVGAQYAEDEVGWLDCSDTIATALRAIAKGEGW